MRNARLKFLGGFSGGVPGNCEICLPIGCQYLILSYMLSLYTVKFLRKLFFPKISVQIHPLKNFGGF